MQTLSSDSKSQQRLPNMDNKVDVLLSLSQWSDEIPSAMVFHSPTQSENGDYNSDTNNMDSPPNDPSYSSEADERAAAKLDALLSNIEKRVEASQQLEQIQARVHDSLVSYHSPYPKDMFHNNNNNNNNNHNNHNTRSNQRLRGANKRNNNAYQGLSLETRKRISSTSRTEMETNIKDMQGRSIRVGSTLNDVSRWFGHATSVGLDIASSHSKMKRRRGGTTNQSSPTSSLQNLNASPESMDQDYISVEELQTEEGLKRHMEALDRMMTGVREAATTLQDTHQQVLSSKTARLNEERKALTEAEGTWTKQLTTAKSRLSKKNIMYKKQEGILTGLKSALRESQLIVERQAVEAKEAKTDNVALKKQIRRLRRDVEDAEGIHKEKRVEAETKIIEMDETIEAKNNVIATLKNKLENVMKELAAAPSRVITPTKQKLGDGDIDVDVEEKNLFLKKRHTMAMNRLAEEHDTSVKRLKQQMLQIESGIGSDQKRNMRDLERVLKAQKQRWVAALESQRTQFEIRASEMKEELTGNNIRAARELETSKIKMEKKFEKDSAALKKTLANIMARNDAEKYRLKRDFYVEKEEMTNAFNVEMNEMKQSATHQLGEIMNKQQQTIMERDKWQQQLTKASEDLIAFQNGSEKQRLNLATATQTIIGLKYQIKMISQDVLTQTKLKMEAMHQLKQMSSKNEELEKDLVNGGGYVIDNGNRLTTHEAQNVISTLGDRVLVLEKELDVAKISISDWENGKVVKKKKKKDINAMPEGFRQFQKYSYMPIVMQGLGKTLMSCGQLAHTLYLLREAPDWMEKVKEEKNEDDDVHSNTQDTKEQDPGYEWTEALDTMSSRIDNVNELFRNAITTLRAEMVQRVQYEEMMCLHFYQRELHWKGLYEAMIRAVQKARGEPQGQGKVKIKVSKIDQSPRKKYKNIKDRMKDRNEAKRKEIGQEVNDWTEEERRQMQEDQKDGQINAHNAQNAQNIQHTRDLIDTKIADGLDRRMEDRDIPVSPVRHFEYYQNNTFEYEQEEDGIDRGSSFGGTPKETKQWLAASRTKSWLPKGVGTSGAVVLSRTTAGAKIDGNMMESTQYGFGGGRSRGNSIQYENKGWTPVPPSPGVGISRRVSSRGSGKSSGMIRKGSASRSRRKFTRSKNLNGKGLVVGGAGM